MRKCMVLMGQYAGQVLTIDDEIAEAGVLDGWCVVVTGRSYPYDVPVTPGAEKPESLLMFEYQVNHGSVSTQALAASPILSISKGPEAVVTIEMSEAPKFISADSVYFEGTGNPKFDNLVFGDIIVAGDKITIVGYTNSAEVSNRGTVIRALYGPNPGLLPSLPLPASDF
jgi:hypothetical protein